jgi:hypothetical protein
MQSLVNEEINKSAVSELDTLAEPVKLHQLTYKPVKKGYLKKYFDGVIRKARLSQHDRHQPLTLKAEF